MQQRFYPYIALAAGALVLLLILWGPVGGGESDRDSIIWQEDWQLIEYYRGSASERPALRLIREPGLVADEYFVETLPEADEASDIDPNPNEKEPEYIRRRGGPSVSNLFRDWRRPKLNAYHELSSERETEFGLDRPEHIVRFYSSPTADPIELRAGKKSGGANRFAASNYHDHKDLLLIVGGYLFDKFTQGSYSYREKRILYYPTGSYTKEIIVRDPEGQPVRVTLEQELRPEGTGGPLNIYRRYNVAGASETTTEIPINIASPLDAAVKSMMIERFRDEPSARSLGDAEDLWNRAEKNFAEVEVEIEKGDQYWIHFRQVPVPDGEDLILVRSSVSIGTDWARRTAIENALKHVQIIRNYVPPEPAPEPTPDDAGTE